MLDEDQFLDLIRTRTAPLPKAEPPVKKPATKPAPKRAAKPTAASDPGPASTGGDKARNGTPGNVAGDPNKSLWSVKYAPESSKKIIGQNGAKSNMNKLKNWLESWHANVRRRSSGEKPKSSGGYGGKKGSEDGWEFAAILMAGPPGVGKTTTAHLVCQELGCGC